MAKSAFDPIFEPNPASFSHPILCYFAARPIFTARLGQALLLTLTMLWKMP